MNYVNLSKDFIETHIIPNLILSKRGRNTKVPYWVIVKLIICRLKTGCQWRELPTNAFYHETSISWNSVFYHFNKWSKLNCWEDLWISLLKNRLKDLDMSSVQIDGSHTPVKNGGFAVGYQHRKKSKTTNMLFLTDKQGIPLAISEPQSGNHNDLYQIEERFKEIVKTVKKANIKVDGLFMNADAGFDAINFRNCCKSIGITPNFHHNKRSSKQICSDHIFDEQLYKDRFVVERTNAWIDGFKNLLVRFETTAANWKSLHYITFSLTLINK